MDKKMIERIALEEKTALCMLGMDKACVDLVVNCPARIDAERGKAAVGILCISHFRDCPEMENTEFQPLRSFAPGQYPPFLSAPTIPEGMAMVPIEPTEAMLIEGRQADTDWMNSDDPEEEFEQGLAYVYKAMIAAAKGERS